MEIFTDFPSPDHKSAHQRTYPPSPSGDVQGCTKIRERQDATQGRVNVASAGCAGATSRAIGGGGDEGTPALTCCTGTYECRERRMRWSDLCPLPKGRGGEVTNALNVHSCRGAGATGVVAPRARIREVAENLHAGGEKE